MKKKVGTVIDENLFLRAKQVAAARGYPLSSVIEEALRIYLEKDQKTHKSGKHDISYSTKGAMKVAPSDLKAVMEEKGIYEID